MVLLACVPLVVAFAMLAMRQNGVRSAIGAAVAGVLVVAFAFPTEWSQLWSSGLAFAPRVVEVVGILLGGIWLNRVLEDAGAQHRLSDWIEKQTSSSYAGALLVVFGIGPLAESVTGFGIGVVIAVPILRHLGFPPIRAAVLGLLTLNCVVWGGLAPGTTVAASLTDLSLQDLGVRSALYNCVVLAIVAIAVVLITGERRRPAAWLEAFTCAAALWAAVLGANIIGGTHLAGAFGGLVAVAAQLVVRRLVARRSRRASVVQDVGDAGDAGESARPTLSLARAAAPYALLISILVLTRLMAPVVSRTVGEGTAEVIASPVVALLITCAAAHLMLRDRVDQHGMVFQTAVRQWSGVAVATGLFMMLGWLYTVSGMSAAIGEAAGSLGPGYLLIAPLLGGVGAFLTGSASGSNAMLAATQAQAASSAGASVLDVIAAHNVATSVATMLNVPRVELTARIAGVPAHETGRILRMLVAVPLASAILLGALSLAFA